MVSSFLEWYVALRLKANKPDGLQKARDDRISVDAGYGVIKAKCDMCQTDQ
jgi:hypothetical protein